MTDEEGSTDDDDEVDDVPDISDSLGNTIISSPSSLPFGVPNMKYWISSLVPVTRPNL